MASPTSHPFVSKQPSASHATPVSASSPPAPPSSHSGTNRSIPSPAYSAVLKPSNRPLHHRNGSAQLPPGSTPRAGPITGGTPRPGTTSAADSPAATGAAAMLMDGHFGIPPVVGMGSGFTPRGIGLTPIAMQMTASQGGLSAAAAALDQEEERKRRIEGIVGMMGMRWGFVSQEGVERCARRLGLECLWEESMGEEGKRMLTIAGHGVLVDVEFRGEEVRGVVLQFEGSRKSVVDGAGAASEVLKRNLRGDGDSEYVVLDGFVRNLERLANMDRLGGPEVNCFDAVEGIHLSLERIHSWEIERSDSKTKEGTATDVTCRQSGRPVVHTRGSVGLALQFWADRRLVNEQTKTVDDMETDKDLTDTEEDDSTVWSAIIECESSPAELYPPIRMSDDWVSEAVEKAAPTDVTNVLPDFLPIDWQDPPPTLLAPKSPTNGAGSLDIDIALQPKPPDVHFVAKIEPPVIVPLQTAIQIHESVGSPLSQDSILPTTLENLLFADVDPHDSLPTTPRITENTVIPYDPATGTSTPHTHRSTLFTQPNDYARAITHLPFSHPRQIIALLPTLRQWALAASILRCSFLPNPTESTPSSPPTEISNGNTAITSQPSQSNGHSLVSPSTTSHSTFQTLESELADFLSSPFPTSSTSTTTSTTASTREISITLTTTPSPRFAIHFPNPSHGGKLAAVSFSVGLNGVIEAIEVDDGSLSENDEGAVKDKVKMREKMKRVIELGESIGVAVEWLIGSTTKNASE